MSKETKKSYTHTSVLATVEPTEIEQKEDESSLSNQLSEVHDAKPAEFDKFKKVSFELMDIGLHYGN